MYCATNVEVYPAVTWSTPKKSQYHMTAGNDAAISSGSCHDSSTVSTKTCTVMKLWLTIRGSASLSSSFEPPGVACWRLRGACCGGLGLSRTGGLDRADRFRVRTGGHAVIRLGMRGRVELSGGGWAG